MIKFFGKKDGDSLRRAYFVDDNNNKTSNCLAVIGTIEDLTRRGLISVIEWGDSKESNYLAITADGETIAECEEQKEAAQAVRGHFENRGK